MKSIKEQKLIYQNIVATDTSLYCKSTLEIAGDGFDAGIEFAQRWIDCSEEFPESQKKVLVKVKLNNGSEIETTAIYVASKTVLASDFLDDYATEELQEYDEEIDDYWAKEGWFEWHYYTEINYLIHDKIIGWRPIELK